MLVEGKLSTRKWQDQQGVDRYTTEVVLSPYNGLLTFLDSKRNGDGNGASGERGPASGGSAPSREGPSSDVDDDVPY